MEGKWMYNLYEEEIWTGEEFDTKEEAIEAAKKELGSPEMEKFVGKFQIGQIAEVAVSGVNIDNILEDVAENTACECGEVGEDYLDDVTSEHRDELEEKLNEVVFAWVKKYNYEPSFFKIENEETITL